MDFLQSIDTELLLAINGWHNAFLDHWLWNITQRYTWIALYVAMLSVIVISRKRSVLSPQQLAISSRQSAVGQPRSGCTIIEKNRKQIFNIIAIVVAIAACAGLADYLSSGVIKHAVERLRPTQNPELEGMLHIVNGYRGGMYGFVSSHAANTFSVALLFSLLVRDRLTTLSLMLWVALNCYSRVYLGVHYPGDILGGLLLGAAVALIIYVILNRTGIAKKEDSSIEKPRYCKYIIPVVFVLTCVVTMF